MKKIELRKLELTNYRNIEHAVYEFNGNSKIVGENRIGKTNTLEAIYFLLTGYLLNGSSDIQAIKPLNNSRSIVSVSGTFDVEGKTIVIEKRYGEDWVKTRNTGEEVFKGHYCELYYNGVKQPTVRDFETLFNEDFGIGTKVSAKISMIQLLTNPFYIGDLCETTEWVEVRKFIVDLVGDVSDEDVFDKEPMLQSLKPELELSNGRLDQVKKRIDGEIKSLQELLLTDDAKIQMLSKTTVPSESEVNGAKLKIKEIDETIMSLRSASGNKEAEVELKSKIADIDIQIANLKSESTPQKNSDLSNLRIKFHNLINQKSSLVNELVKKECSLETAEAILESSSNKKDDLLDEYRELKNAEIKVETVCPTCKRPLEQAEIEKAKKNLIEERGIKLDLIILEGKKTAAEIESKRTEIESIKAEKEKTESSIKEIEKQIIEVSKEIEKAEGQIQEPTVDKEKLSSLENAKLELKNKLTEIRNNDEKSRMEVNTQIYELEQSKEPFKKILDDLAYAERQKENKEACETEKRIHSKTLIQKEQLKDMVKKFTATKLEMLDANVSKVFGGIKFQLIKPNINGGFDTVCKPFIYDPISKSTTSVLWKSGSKSERVATGIAIAEVIKKQLGLSNLPYLFDEGGELSSDTVANRLKTDSQIICVKVQDGVSVPLVLAL